MEVEKASNQKQPQSQAIISQFSLPIKRFYQFHGVQILGSQIPVKLIEMLYKKLLTQNYDGGNYFEIIDNEQIDTFEVRVLKDLKKQSNIFLIDHALTFRQNQLRSLLKAPQNSKILPRLQNMLKYYHKYKKIATQNDNLEKQTEENHTKQLQRDQIGLMNLDDIELNPNLVTLSLIGNQLNDAEDMIKKLNYLNLKVLWINGNPIQDSEQIFTYVNEKTNIQLFNSKFLKNCTSWGIKYVQNRNLKEALFSQNSQIYSLNLDNRNVQIINIDIFAQFNQLKHLSLKEHAFDSEEKMQVLLKIISEIKTLSQLEVDYNVELQLFKMFKLKKIGQECAKKLLVNSHCLLNQPPSQTDWKIDKINKTIFKIADNYRLASSEKLDSESVWYINDELGTLIPHSDDPSVILVPFLYAKKNKLDTNTTAFSLLWPIKDLKKDQMIYRDYLKGLPETKQRSSRLAIWYEIPVHYHSSSILSFNKKMTQTSKSSISTLQKFYSRNAVKQKQYIMELNNDIYSRRFKLITDDDTVRTNLKLKRIDFIENIQQSDIIWQNSAVQEQLWQKYRGKYYLNQFPYESCVVMKQNLAEVIQSVFGDTKYLMRTYNLQTQLSSFLGDYYNRKKNVEDNLWIIKPPNMARSMDMIITDSLPLIIKSIETGPKIIQKYITNPVLRKNKKVDLRYIIAVKSITPLILYLYKHFWIRSANNQYTIDRRHLNTYQTQFTVMNYGDVSQFKQIPYDEFIKDFEIDYAPITWQMIDDKIKKMLRNVFIACVEKHPEMHDEKCRAVYGVDIMIDTSDMEPKLLQITFAPDCKRACEYYPQFYNEVFETLFLEQMGPNMIRVI